MLLLLAVNNCYVLQLHLNPKVMGEQEPHSNFELRDSPMNVDQLYQSVNTESACRIFLEFVYRLVASLHGTADRHCSKNNLVTWRQWKSKWGLDPQC
jgi:hypothetical protein